MKKTLLNHSSVRALAISLASLSLAAATFAQSGVWTSASGGSWTTAANWSNNIIAAGSGNTADFSQLSLSSGVTLTLDETNTIGKLLFNDLSGGENTWALSAGSGGPLILAVSSGTPIISAQAPTTISVALAGTNGLTTTGTNTLTLASADTNLTGGTTVSQGALALNNTTAAGTGTITLGDLNTGTNNVELILNAASVTNNIVVSAQGSGTATLFATYRYSSSTGTITLNRPTTLMLTNMNEDWWFGFGLIGGNVGTLTLTSRPAVTATNTFPVNDRFQWSGPNTFVGTVVIAGGVVQNNNSTSMGSGGNSLTVNSDGVLNVYSGTPTVDALNGSGAITCNNGTQGLSIGNANGSGAFSGTIGAFGDRGINLTKNGAGTEILTGTNAYIGTTTVSNGALLVNSPGYLAAGSAVTVWGGMLGGNGTVNGLVTAQNGGLVSGSLTLNGSVLVASGGLVNGALILNGITSVQSGGTLAAGTASAIGTMTCTNAILFQAGGISSMRISKTGGTINTDQITGSGTGAVSYGGTLMVANVTIDSTALSAGDTFTLFPNWANYSGGFATYVLPTLPGSLTWDVSKLTVNGSIVVSSSTAPPSFTPPAGGYVGAQSVTLSSLTPGAAIYYTTNGSQATTASTLYSGAIMVPANVTLTINAIAKASSLTASADVSAKYVTTTSLATWINTASPSSWQVSANWSNGIIANGSGITADFSQLTLPGSMDVTLDSPWTIGYMITGDMGSNYNWQFDSGGGGTLTFNAGANTPVVTTLNGTNTITALVGGANGLLKTGAGTLTLANPANTYTGPTTLSLGALAVGNGASGAAHEVGTGTITLGDSNTGTNDIELILDSGTQSGNSLTNNIIVSAQSSGNVTIYATQRYVGNNGTITLNRPTTLKTFDDGGTDWWYNYNKISGNVGTLTLEAGAVGNASRMDFSGPNTFVGTVVCAQGRVQIGDGGNQAFGNGGNSLTININADIRLYNETLTVDALNGEGSIYNDNDGTLQTVSIGNANGSGNFAGNIGAYSDTGINLIKNGAGTEILSGASAYRGATTINGGTLEVDGSIGTGSAVSVNAGATLDGTGVLYSPVIVNSGGTLTVSTNPVPAVLYASGTVTLKTGSTTALRISKTGGAAVNDQIKGQAASIVYAGTLAVTNVTSDATQLASGDSFVLFPTFTYSGGFNNYILPALPATLSWDTTQLASSGTLAVFTGTATPFFSPPSEGYVGALSVIVASLSPGATIYYTTDGSAPIPSSPHGVTPITLALPAKATTTIKAYAQLSGAPASGVASATYQTEPGPAVWINPYGTSWDVAGNWTNNIIPNNIGATVDFSELLLPGDELITLDGSWTVGNMIFGDLGTNFTCELDPGVNGALTLNAGTNTPVINVINEVASITAPMAGNNGLIKTGAGALAVSGDNIFSGGTTIAQGTYTIGALTSAGSGPITLGSASTGTNNVQLVTSANIPNPIIVSTNGTGTAMINWTQSGGWGSSATLSLNRPTTLTTSNATSYGSLGVVTGNVGTLTLDGSTSGPLGLMQSNSFTGTIVLASGNSEIISASSLSLNAVVIDGSNSVFAVGNSYGSLPILIGSLSGIGSVAVRSDGGAVQTGQTLSIGNDNGSANYSGTITDGSNPMSILKAGSGVETLSGSNAYSGTTTVSGGTLEVDGLLTGTGAVTVSGGALDGSGSMAGATTIQSGGTLAAGNPSTIGTLTIANALTLNAGSVTMLKLDKATAANDAVAGVSTLTYGGTLTVANLAGTLAKGDSFKLFNAATYAGNFAATSLPALGPGLGWSWMPTNGTLAVVTAANPPVLSGMASLKGSSFSITFSGTNGQNYTVLMTTNLALPLADWTALSSGIFGASPVNYTNTQATNSAQFYRIMSP